MTQRTLDIRRPGPLAPGSLVRIISPALPSMAYAANRVERARATLEGLGLRVDFSPNCFEISDDGRSAGTAQMRADDLHGAFADPEVAAVLCAAGGSTSAQLLPLLSPAVFADNPKPLIGRSDNIVLSAFLASRARVSSYVGVTYVFQLGELAVADETLASFRQVLMADGPVTYQVSPSRTLGGRDWRTLAQDETPLERPRPGHHGWLRPGVGSGPLLGAELSVLPRLVEAELLDPTGCVLWWDPLKPELSYTYEWLERMAKLIDFRTLNGMLIGDNPWVDYGEWLAMIQEFVDRHLGGTDFPIFVGGDCGHYDPAWVLPYGDRLVLDSQRGVIYRDGEGSGNPHPGADRDQVRGGPGDHDRGRTGDRVPTGNGSPRPGGNDGGEGAPVDDRNLAAVTGVFEEVLGKRVGPDDNFFKLGGHSLLVVQAIALLRHTHGLRVPARQFLDQGTPAAIAGACTVVEPPQAKPHRDGVTTGR